MPFQFDSSNNLNVNVQAGGGAGSNSAAGPTGSAVPANADYTGLNIAGNLVGLTGISLTNAKAATVAIVDSNGSQITSFGGGTQFADNAASGATPTGTLSMGWDSGLSKVRSLKVDASQNLNVNLAANSFGTLTVSGTVTANQGGAPWSVDVTDRAVRLLGVVYGSQAQQLKQTATNFNLQTELATGGTLYDARQIRALTSADAVDVSDRTARLLGHVTVDNATLAVTQSTSPWVTQDAADAATGGLVPAKAIFVGANKSGNLVGLSTDASGNLNVNLAAGSISGGNAAASPTGSPVPASADYTGFNLGGNLVGVSSANPLPQNLTQVSGSAIAIGQAAMVASLPVVIASDQSAIKVFGTNTNNVDFPGTDHVSVLLAVANAATQTWTEGHEVELSVDLSGRLRITDPTLLPLPTNAAQETGGNLSTIATLNRNNAQMADTLNMVVAQLKLLNLNLASSMPSAYVDQDSALIDTFPVN